MSRQYKKALKGKKEIKSLKTTNKRQGSLEERKNMSKLNKRRKTTETITKGSNDINLNDTLQRLKRNKL